MPYRHSLQKRYLDSFISDRREFNAERQLSLENNGGIKRVSTNSFDKQLRDKILKDFEENKGRELASAYEQAQLKLQQEVYKNIPGTEPSLSDHGTTHVSNVQQNAIRLLSDDGIIGDLSGIEMYCLGMFILFHDAGNVYGRENHRDNVAKVFDRIRGKNASLRREKTLVVRATRAHTGTAQDGSPDTLKELDEKEHLEGQPVRLRELAAVLRFADELAEGPQRTSQFMQAEGLYESESQQFHDYANITHILIERGTNRIILTYEIDIDVDQSNEVRRPHLSRLLKFVYERIRKLNQERQYARYYSELLAPFKFTEISFNFHYDGYILDTDLLPLKLTDIVVPGDQTKEISDIDPAYSIDKLVGDLLARCQEGRGPIV